METPTQTCKTATCKEPESYGPIRRRITGKDGPFSPYRPAVMKQDDFVEVMKEIVPELIEQTLSSSSSAGPSLKRDQPETTPAEASEPAASRARTSEVLSVQERQDLLDVWDNSSSEVFMAEYLKRKMAKEVPPTNHPPTLQKMVDEGKSLEWQTSCSKPYGVRMHYGKQAERIRNTQAHRFIGSRFVLTRKPIDEGREVDPNDLTSFTIKGKWCLQGHLDPDLDAKAQDGRKNHRL